MLNKVIDRLIPNYSQLRSRTVFLCLLALSFFLRFPFVYRDYIDRDESTFILVGQAWVDGFLPYTELWDLKPPLTFLFFATIISVFGKSLIAIRLAGILVVAIIAWYTYKISKEISSGKVSLWAAVLTVFLVSMFGSLQGVMSEHLSMLFLMPALYLLIKHRTGRQYFLAGLLIGAAVMTKINLAYPALFLGLFIFLISVINSARPIRIGKVLILAIGGLLAVGLTVLPYSLEDQTALWWKAVVLAPLEYSGARRHSLLRFAPLLLFLAALLTYGIKKKVFDLKDYRIQILMIAIIGVVFAFLRGGRINGHYLIQLHPILIILVSMIFASLPVWKWNFRPFALLILLVMPAEAYNEYYSVINHKINRGSFVNGEGYVVPDFIENESLPVKNILFLEYHIAYWFLDLKPPTMAATHPTNLVKDEIFPFFSNPRKSSMEELRFILEDIAPEIIITRNRWRVFDKKEVEQNNYVREFLETHYKIIELVDEAEIHRRSN